MRRVVRPDAGSAGVPQEAEGLRLAACLGIMADRAVKTMLLNTIAVRLLMPWWRSSLGEGRRLLVFLIPGLGAIHTIYRALCVWFGGRAEL